ETLVMTGALDGLPLPDGSAEAAEEPDEAWFEASEAAAGRSPARLAEQRAAPSLLMVPAAWITVRVEARAVSVASVGVDGPLAGLSWLATLPALRGQGMGRRACLAAFAWARAEGARIAWLQVEAENDAALSLCRRLGFREAYRCAYRVRA
ncbi:MAG: GNAT family N-acetyltransferase, partial [Acetobacteraceae bacterium]